MSDAEAPRGGPVAALLREPALRRGFVAYWAAFGVMLVADDLATDGVPGSLEAAWVTTRQSLWGVVRWVGVSLAALYVAGRFPLRRGRARNYAVVALAAVAATGGYALGLRVVNCALGWGECGPARDMLRPAPTVLWVFLGIIGVGHAMSAVIRRREQEVARSVLEAQLAEARLQALQMQLQPHFLFNAMQSVSTLMHRDVEGATRVLERLGGLVRSTLTREAVQEVPLAEELEVVRLYTGIEAVRFSDRLRVETCVDPSVLDALVPSLLLQPLVENAVRHGVAARRGPGRVRVEAGVHEGALRLTVRDNGPGFAPAGKGPPRGIGLANTRERLIALYGPAHRFEAGRDEDGGARVTITIPLRRAGSGTSGEKGDDSHPDR